MRGMRAVLGMRPHAVKISSSLLDHDASAQQARVLQE